MTLIKLATGKLNRFQKFKQHILKLDDHLDPNKLLVLAGAGIYIPSAKLKSLKKQITKEIDKGLEND